MSYKEKYVLKLFKYDNGFSLIGLIDDYESLDVSFSKYYAHELNFTINRKIPNTSLLEEGIFIQLGNISDGLFIVKTIKESIDETGTAGNIYQVNAKDCRYLYKQRIVMVFNGAESYEETGVAEQVIRNLITSQTVGKRSLPIINENPASPVGTQIAISEKRTNLYDAICNYCEQSGIGWKINFDGEELTLQFYETVDISQLVKFDVKYESLKNGQFTDSTENYKNVVYVGGKGNGTNQAIYEAETEIEGESPSGIDRHEIWENESNLTTEEELQKAGESKLNEYGQKISFDGNGLEKSPYEFRTNYNIGNIVEVSFDEKIAYIEILTVSESWSYNTYSISFEFGKPYNSLSKQMNKLYNWIQKYNESGSTTSDIKYYTIPTDTQQLVGDVTLDVIGFTGNIGDTNKTFQLYFNSDGTGAKTYHVYFKQLEGSAKLVLTTGVEGASNLEFKGGTYVSIIYVDEDGNVKLTIGIADETTASTSTWSSEKTQTELNTKANTSDLSAPIDAILHYSFDEVPDMPDGNANIRYKNGQTYSLMGICGINLNPTITNINGNLNVKGSVDGAGIFTFGLTGNICVIKIKLKGANLIFLGFENFNARDITESGVYAFPFDNNGSHAFIAYAFGGDREFEIEEFYTGDGSYTTPIIDNNYGGYNSSYIRGIIATKGVCGKGITLPNSNSNNDCVVISDVFNKLYSDFTFSIWVNPENKIENVADNIIASSEQFILRNGASWSNTLMLYIYTNVNGTVQENWFNMVGLLDADKWTHIVITKNGTTVKLYIDGELGYTGTCQGSILNHNSNSVYLPTTQRTKSLDDFQIFDRALSEEEVKALYLNKGNTPKFYTRADYLLDNQN